MGSANRSALSRLFKSGNKSEKNSAGISLKPSNSRASKDALFARTQYAPAPDSKPVDTGPGEERYKVGGRTTHPASKILAAITGNGDVKGDGITIGSAIRLDDITIDGILDLSALSVSKPLIFSNCLFSDPVIARNTRFDLLKIDQCTLPTINLYQIRTTNSVLITASSVRSGIDMAEAEIDGLLDLNSTDIQGPLRASHRTGFFDGDRDAAINAYNINVARSFKLDCIRSVGVINLRLSKVGSLDADGASLSCADGGACLDARGMISSGDVTIGRGFECYGSLSLISAKIEGRVDFRGGVFNGVGDEEVISCDGVNAGNIFFQQDKFTDTPAAIINGRVVLSNAIVGGRLDLRGATINLPKNSDHSALDCDFSQFAGNVLLCQEFRANGAIRFHQAIIEGQFNMDGAKVLPPRGGEAIVLNSARVDKNVFFRYGFECAGEINGIGAELGGILSFMACRLDARNRKYAIQFRKARITRSVEIMDNANIRGSISFRGARIGFSFKCIASTISRCGSWLDMDETVSGEEDFERNVTIDLLAADVGTSIDFEKIQSFDGCIDLRRAKTRIYYDDGSAWGIKKDKNSNGQFLLDGFAYEYFPQFRNAGMERYEEWLDLRIDADSKRDLSVQPWSHLSNVLRQSGHEVTARNVAFAREKARQGYLWKKKNIPRWLFSFLFGLIVGHGYQPQRGLMIAVAIIASGWLVYGHADRNSMIEPAQAAVIAKFRDGGSTEIPRAYGHFQPLVFSIDVFVPFLNLHQEDRWLPVDACSPTATYNGVSQNSWQWLHKIFKRDCTLIKTSSYKLFMTAQVIFGWVVLALTGLAFSIVFRRE